MKKTWLSSILLFWTLLLSTADFAQQKNEFSVKQCVEYANNNAIPVLNALIDVDIQRQQNRQITSAALPQISGSISGNHYFNIPIQPIPDFVNYKVYDALEKNGVKDGSGRAITNPGNFPTLPFSISSPWNASGSIDVQQLLFDGQVFVGLIARKVVLDYQSKVTEVTSEQIKANVYKIYYQLVIGKKQLFSLDANILRFDKLLHDTKEIFKSGFAEKLDVDKVTVQLSNIRTERDKIEHSLAAGNAGLKFLMNMPQKVELVLTDTLSEADLKSGILEENYSYKDRKEMQMLDIAEKLGGYNVRRYKLSKIPTLAAFASYSKNAQRTSFNFFNKGNWYSTSLAGLKISIPIFDGNLRNAHIQQAKYELKKMRNMIALLKENIDYDVEHARINMKNALITIDNQKQNIELAEKVYRTTKKKYEQGLGSNQEIYFAETELKVAQTNYYSALYDAINAKIDYLKAVGKL